MAFLGWLPIRQSDTVMCHTADWLLNKQVADVNASRAYAGPREKSEHILSNSLRQASLHCGPSWLQPPMTVPALFLCALCPQALTRSSTAACTGIPSQPAVVVIKSILHQCQQWLQEHARQQQEQLQQQQSAPDTPAVGAQTAKTDSGFQDLVRWHNRCLRSILATVKSGEAAGKSADISTGRHLQVAPAEVGFWLPEVCWQPVRQPAGHTEAQAAQSTNSNRQAGTVWQTMLPSWQTQQYSCAAGVTAGAGTAGYYASRGGSAMPRLAVLQYCGVQQLTQHTRHLQKLQQLLLHQHVEAQLAPAIMQCLLTECQGLGLERSCKFRSQQEHKEGERQLQQDTLATTTTNFAVHQERFLYLYRLLHCLVASAATRRGLGGICHLVEHAAVDDFSALHWL